MVAVLDKVADVDGVADTVAGTVARGKSPGMAEGKVGDIPDDRQAGPGNSDTHEGMAAERAAGRGIGMAADRDMRKDEDSRLDKGAEGWLNSMNGNAERE